MTKHGNLDSESQCQKREAARVSAVEVARKRLNRGIERSAGDTAKQTSLRQELAVLNQGDQAARVKYAEDLRALTS